MSTFRCNKCGNCCKVSGYVRLKEGEAKKIARFLNLAVHDFTEQYTRLTRDRLGLSLTEQADESCIFLQADATCRINPVKPRQCGGFPHAWNFPGWEKLCSGKE